MACFAESLQLVHQLFAQMLVEFLIAPLYSSMYDSLCVATSNMLQLAGRVLLFGYVARARQEAARARAGAHASPHSKSSGTMHEPGGVAALQCLTVVV